MIFHIDPKDDEAKNLTNIIFLLHEMTTNNKNNLDARLALRDARKNLEVALHFVKNPVRT